MKRNLGKSFIAILGVCTTIMLAAGHDVKSAHAEEPRFDLLAQAPAPTGTGEGEVRKIDKATKKVTLRHGPIQELDMEAMTMVFQVADPAMLDQIAVGNKVKFTVRQGGGALTLLSIEQIK